MDSELSPPPLANPTWDRSRRLERLAGAVLRGPLTAVLVALGVVELATWVPHYLTWPWFADHDVFATAARAWHAGQLPYRDVLGNNFPGTIYLFWFLGKMFGWGYTPALFGADATLVVWLGAIMLLWSRRRFGRFLPGAVGYLTFLAYYLSLDYSQVAQRDWHGPCFAVSALLIAEAWPGRAGRLVSALAMALALTVRPQTILLMPALAMTLSDESAPATAAPGKKVRIALEWTLALAVFLALAFAPLFVAGVFSDFLRGVRLAAYGASYNKANLATFVKELLIQIAPLRIGAVLVSIVLLAGRTAPPMRRLALTWLVATAAVLLYKPMSPLPHAYLNHPLMLVWSINVAVLVQLSLEAGLAAPSIELALVLLILGLGATGRPRFCNPRASLRALTLLREGKDPDVAPLGYTHNIDVGKSAPYPWDDYRALLQYLRTEVPPSCRVANALKGVPAVAGPTGRLSAFPAESIAWLYMIKHDDEARFAQALADIPDSVVVWAPSERKIEPTFTLERLRPVIEQRYEPMARFGAIEVWRRKPAEATPTHPDAC